MSLAVVDHAAIAVSRLRQQFRERTKIEAYLAAIAAECQAVESAFQDLLVLRRIDVATGAALTRLGDLVGQRYLGYDEAEFRRMIRARIATNRSRGTTEDLIRVTAAFFANLRPPLKIVVDRQGTAAVVVRLAAIALALAAASEGHDDATLVELLLTFLRKAKAAGVRLIVEWAPQAVSDSFVFPPFASLDAPLVGGESSFTVHEGYALTFAPLGTITIDAGLAVAEDVAYEQRTHDTFILTGTVAHAHTAEAAVTQKLPVPGKGLGDDGNPATGGAFAGARA